MSHHKKEIVIDLGVLKPKNGFELVNHIAKLMSEAKYSNEDIRTYMSEAYQNGANKATEVSKKWVKFAKN